MDYWLTAELTTSDIRTGTVSMRIKQTLAPHIGRTQRKQQHVVYEALRLKSLQDVRDVIAHGNVDSVSSADLRMVAAIATELIRSEIGLQYSGNTTIDAALSEYDRAHVSE